MKQCLSGKSVEALERRLLELDQHRLTTLLLMMRRSEKDFVLHDDEKYGTNPMSQETEFETALSGASLSPDVKSYVLELNRSYKASFVSLMLPQQALSDRIGDLGREAEALHSCAGSCDQDNRGGD